MVWGSKENGPVPSPPEGFSLYTKECGMVVLRRRKQRNLQKLGDYPGFLLSLEFALSYNFIKLIYFMEINNSN